MHLSSDCEWYKNVIHGNKLHNFSSLYDIYKFQKVAHDNKYTIYVHCRKI